MSITKKALLRRIKSLENLLDVVYVSPETNDDYEYHQQKDYGIFDDVKKVFRWYKKSNKDKDE